MQIGRLQHAWGPSRRDSGRILRSMRKPSLRKTSLWNRTSGTRTS